MDRKISIADVRHMADLSRLIISEEEEKLFARQFGLILGHVEILNQVDTAGVEPMYSPALGDAPLRLDVAENTRTPGAILANAPETDGQCFIVPRIV